MFRAIAFLAAFALLPGSVGAHEDPRGDVHPQIWVENGNFAVYFRSNLEQREYDDFVPSYRVVYSPQGKLLAPRHSVAKIPDAPGADRWSLTATTREGESLSFARFSREYHGKPSYTVTQDGRARHYRLPWPNNVEISDLHAVTADEKSIMVAATATGSKFSFYHFVRGRFLLPSVAEIGQPNTIYEFPVASNIVQAGGKFWIAWMRWNEEKQIVETVLSHWQPGVETVTSVALNSPGDGNSHLSLATNGDALCLAYHCLTANAWHSQIVTWFQPVK